MSSTLRTGISALFRRLPPPDDSTDASLLARFVQTRDEPAFAEMVRRHGGMVLSVCRRRLGAGPDADDAYQVTFLALARDAHKVRGESLAGWLHRVAHLTALKLCGRTHRNKPEPLSSEPAAPMTPDPPDADLRTVIDEELAALPDRFRGVAVLCLVEGLTNTEAAVRLGIPKGTVDSRLSTAKVRLRDRLLRRGIAAATVAGLESTLGSGTAAASVRAAALAVQLIPKALHYAAGAPVPGSEHLSTLADGVHTTMPAISTKWLTAAVLTTGLIGGGGIGVYHATADEQPQQAEKKTDPKKPAAEQKPPTDPNRSELVTDRPGVKTADDVQRVLQSSFDVGVNQLTFEPFAQLLNERYGLTVRFDTPAFIRRGVDKEALAQLQANAQVNLAAMTRLPIADVVREALGQLSGVATTPEGNALRLSYRIKGNQILIVPEYQPPTVPGAGASMEGLQVSQSQLIESLYGEPVTVRYKNQPITQVIEDLQGRTGANIVLNTAAWKAFPEGEQRAETKITANFNDTRLLTVLRIVGNMCDLKPVVIDNVYYLTDEASAAKLQQEADRDLFGEPAPAVPAGFVTDGYQLYPKTADMKPAEGLGLGGMMPFRVKPVPAPEKK